MVFIRNRIPAYAGIRLPGSHLQCYPSPSMCRQGKGLNKRSQSWLNASSPPSPHSNSSPNSKPNTAKSCFTNPAVVVTTAQRTATTNRSHHRRIRRASGRYRRRAVLHQRLAIRILETHSTHHRRDRRYRRHIFTPKATPAKPFTPARGYSPMMKSRTTASARTDLTSASMKIGSIASFVYNVTSIIHIDAHA